MPQGAKCVNMSRETRCKHTITSFESATEDSCVLIHLIFTSNILPCKRTHFHGLKRITKCIKRCALLLISLFIALWSDSFSGRGHSFHGSGGRGGKKAQMRYCVRVLRSVVSLDSEPLRQDLCDQGAIGQLLGECGESQRSLLKY